MNTFNTYDQLQIINSVPRLCQFCGNTFLQYDKRDAAKYCPTCIDQYQMRKSVVINRQQLYEFRNVTIVSLPSEWKIGKAKDGKTFTNKSYHNNSYYIIDKKGNDYGVNWNGRITIYSQYPFEIGNIVNVRIMEVSHIVKAQYTKKQTVHGNVIVRTKLELDKDMSNLIHNNLPYAQLHDDTKTVTPCIRNEIETYQYVVFEPSNNKPHKKHIGFYTNELPNNSLWYKQISGSNRDDTNKTTAWLAITITNTNLPTNNNENDNANDDMVFLSDVTFAQLHAFTCDDFETYDE